MCKKIILFTVLSILAPVNVFSDTADSLYRQAREEHFSKHQTVNQLFVLLDAEGVTDSLLQMNRRDNADEVGYNVSYYMGVLYNDTYRYGQAADAFNRAVHHARERGDERKQAEALSALAVQYHKMGDFEHSIHSCIEALRIDSLLHDAEALSCDLNILSGSCLSAGHIDDAVRYILKAIEWEKSRPEPSKLAIRYGSAAEILNKSGDTDKALHFSMLAYELDRQKGNSIGLARRMSQMADIYQNRKEYDVAERYYRRAIDTLETHQELHSLGIDYRLLADVLQKQGRHGEAISFYQKAHQLAQQTGNRFFRSLVMRGMAESYRATGNDAKAAECLQMALTLSDSLHSERQEQMAAEFRTQFDLKEAELQSQHWQNAVRKQQVLLAVLAIALLAALIGVLFWRRKRRKEKTVDTMEDYQPKKEKKKGRMQSEDRQFLTRVSDFVHTNMKSRKITIDLVAEHMCMSRNQFVRRLSAASGETPNNYLIRIRMEKAVRLLQDTTMPIKEVAYECGFDESNYFIHVFRQMYGVTPLQFRQTPEARK